MRYNIPIMQSTKRYVLIATTLGAFLIPFMGSAINIAMPAIAKEFKMDAPLQPWVTTSYLIAAAAFLVPFGKLSDIYGRKRIFAVGTLVFSLSSLMAALSTSSDMLMASRVIQGISGAMIFGTSIALLLSVYPAEERGGAWDKCSVDLLRPLHRPVHRRYHDLPLRLEEHFLSQYPARLDRVHPPSLETERRFRAASKGERFDIPGAIIYVLMLIAITYGLGHCRRRWEYACSQAVCWR